MSDKTTELSKRHFEAVDKYVYFLLAAAGASIGFAVQKVENRQFTYSLIPLGISVLCWGISFYFGSNCLKNKNRATEANLHTLTQYDIRKSYSIDDQIKSINLFSDYMTKSKRFNIHQFNFLIAGVILYVFWAILEMYIRTTK